MRENLTSQTSFSEWLLMWSGCLKKNVLLWKMGNNYLQTHPKSKSWGCFWKFRIFATKWALRFSKLNKKWLRKWSLKLPTPPIKNRQNSLLSIYIYWSSQPFFRALWSLNLTHQAKGTKLPLLYLLPTCGTSFAFIASHESEEDHQRSA